METNQDAQQTGHDSAGQSSAPASSGGQLGSLIRITILIFVFGLIFVFSYSWLNALETENARATSEYSSEIHRAARKTRAILHQKQAATQPAAQERKK